MEDKDTQMEKEEEDKIEYYYEDEEAKRRFPTFLLLILITTFGVMIALGLSLSAVQLLGSNETINTLISSLKGEDNKDKYIITYVENTGDFDNNSKNYKDGSLYISSAKLLNSTNDGLGEVTYYGGLMLTTKTTFNKNNSTVTYEIILKNDSPVTKTFTGIYYNQDKGVKYTLSGIKEGDQIKAGKSVKAYLTVEYNGKDTIFPTTIESSSEFNFEQEDKGIYIANAEFYKSNDGLGEVIYYGGLMLTTKTTLKGENSTVTYEIVLKNDSKEAKKYTGISYNKDGNVKYTISGIKEGDIFISGESKTIYLIVEKNGNTDFPVTVESSVELEFSDFGISTNEHGIYLINQFPTSDEVGKLFQGRNYVFNFTLLVGKKTAGAYYEITAIENSDNTLNPSYVKLYLEKNGRGVDLSYRTNGRVKVFTEYQKSEHEEATGRVIYKGYISEDDAKIGKINFVMRMWISEDVVLDETAVETYNNRSFSVKVNTYAMFEG